MQCANCHFENLPGLDLCGRCGASLRIATAVIDVHPPRASQRRFRRLGFDSWLRRKSQAVSTMLDSALWTSTIDRPPSLVVARMIVPGWPQVYLGQTARGRLFLWTYGVFMALALVLLGTNWGSLLLGLALAVHAASVIDIVFTGMSRGRSAFYFCLIYGGFVALLVYWPAIFLFSRLAVPLEVMVATGSLEPGDIVLCNPSAYRWSSPQPGDIVLYDMNSVRLRSYQTQGHRNVIYGVEGRQMDRILAGPGQKATVVEGDLRIDGNPESRKPLNASVRFEPLTLTVPSGFYLIVPSGVPLLNNMISSQLVSQGGLVPSSAIEGKIYFRKYPFNRLGFIR
jgi:hypothetical protein